MSSALPFIIVIIAALAAFAAGAVIARRRGYAKLGEVVVRCRRGHFFTTEWAARASVHGIDLGWARIQHCPVGDHLTLVVLVKESDLTPEQQRQAREHRDSAFDRRAR